MRGISISYLEKYLVLIPFFKDTFFKKFYLQMGTQMVQLFK